MEGAPNPNLPAPIGRIHQSPNLPVPIGRRYQSPNLSAPTRKSINPYCKEPTKHIYKDLEKILILIIIP